MATVQDTTVDLDTTALLHAMLSLKAGDFSARLPVDWTGVAGKVADAFNEAIERNERMARELERLSRVVGKEGRITQRASLGSVTGSWAESISSVNELIDNLVHPTHETARVIGAVAQGDLSQTMALEVDDRPLQGEFLRTATTINKMVNQLGSFASEVTRVAREVGTEGKLGGQADVKGVAGTWKDLTDSVNSMAGNLTGQVRNIADVTTAVANGDLSKKITVDVKGEFLELKNTINTMVDQLRSFAAEVTRVAREVGTEGKLGGQANVRDVAGTWKDLTDSVNSMAGNLTGQVRNIAEVTTAVANGDLSKKITVDVRGEILELKNTINTMVDQLRSFAAEVTRVAREVGTEGKLGGQANVNDVAGTWKDLTDSVNFMAGNLTSQVRNIADVTKAVASGDLSKKITVDVRGEILELKNTVNTMVDQLSSFASEVTRVAREVGTEGILGGQAEVKGVSGTWKDLTDSVNFMAGNLTSQVRGIAKVVTAVANGDLKQKLTVEAKGEIAALADTINGMIDTLATFADQVTTVAREVGVEGQLGGQAKVPGAAGTWKGLTENVNQLAANLTTQVRAIAEVATAVTKGDLTRHITVEAQGEVAALKDNINEMIRNLKETTLKNSEQDWLKTNLAKFSRMLQGQRDLSTVGRLILSELVPVVSAQQAVFYILDSNREPATLSLLASYADRGQTTIGSQLALGEGLVGQCAIEKQKLLISNMPPDYIRISSALGDARPQNIIVLPVIFEGQVKGVLELASLEKFSSTHQTFIDQLTESIGIVLNTIEANMRTEDLLKQSQSLAHELQTRQEELQNTNEELQEKARLLAHQNQEVERKNQEVEQARQALEEKAKQLALTSKYKSEFLANMSHELRTPLNSLLILSDQLSKNMEGNLTGRQTEFAKTIHSSGNDLLMLINDILDLSKIESGTVVVDVGELRLGDLQNYVERTFRHVAESKSVDFHIQLAPDLPPLMYTDAKRLQQVIKNLLSNAFKFTHYGSVSLSVQTVNDGWNSENDSLNMVSCVLAFSVTDTGIGISADKQQIIFEAFQQADGSTSRKYGGTGLGLAISRELSRLLGGEIRLFSTPGRGSTFTLYLPQSYTPPRTIRRTPGGEPILPATFSRSVDLKMEGGANAVAMRESAVLDAETMRMPDVVPIINEAGDDRDSLHSGLKRVLIVENDLPFAKMLLEVARDNGMKGLVTSLGASALTMAREYAPHAIFLDICLPDIDGWRVIERLKNDLATRHIPVWIISTEEAADRSFISGALGFVAKPVQNRETLDDLIEEVAEFTQQDTRRLLMIEPDSQHAKELGELLADSDLELVVAQNEQAAREILADHVVDCVIVAVQDPPIDFDSFIRAETTQSVMHRLPVILYKHSTATDEEAVLIRRLAETCVVFQVQSKDRLLDQVALALHIPVASLSNSRRELLEQLHQSDKVLANKNVLIVDDDIRNIFALSSAIEPHGMKTLSAETGRDAIAQLKANPNIDIVLMDIMMPEMDGYETIHAIRELPEFRNLPIVAVTAKAMKGDRERCIEAGAWDYLSKPVDTEQMLAVLRAWLHR